MANLTGIGVDDECMSVWNDFKIGHKYRFITFTFNGNLTKIIVDKKGARESTYDDFLNALPRKDVAYAVYDYDFKAEDGSARNKLVFVVWAPDNAPPRKKMVLTGSKISIKNALAGISLELQANDDSEIQESEMNAKCMTQAY